MASASLLAVFEVVVLIFCVCVTLVVQAARFIYTTFFPSLRGSVWGLEQE